MKLMHIVQQEYYTGGSRLANFIMFCNFRYELASISFDFSLWKCLDPLLVVRMNPWYLCTF